MFDDYLIARKFGCISGSSYADGCQCFGIVNTYMAACPHALHGIVRGCFIQFFQGRMTLLGETIDPGRLTLGRPRGPVRVLDAHPDTPEPPQPRFPGGRWELDDAAYDLGPGEVAAGVDGPLSWEVLDLDGSG